MDTLDAMKAFVKVAEAGSFAEAARRLDMAPPVVTRAIQALEARVGTRLFHRTTRRVGLTEDKAIAAAATTGDSSRPKNGYISPGASGIPATL